MALKMNDKKIPFGGHLGGYGLLIILLVVSLVLVIVYAREGDEGPLHSLQDSASALACPLSATRIAFVGRYDGWIPRGFRDLVGRGLDGERPDDESTAGKQRKACADGRRA